MSILSLQSVYQKLSARLTVTDDASFDVPQGQALGIIGPNGAGKSTLFNLITGTLTCRDQGSIHFEGRDVTKGVGDGALPDGDRAVVSNPAAFEKLTVYENLLVAATHGRNMSEAAVRDDCAEVLERTELIAQANTPAGQLSLLERKRLELSRAMATQPKLLLLDEIAGGLTEGECQALIRTIKDIHAQGVTIIWIEHVLHALTSVVERLLVLDFGKVIGLGDPDEIMASREVQEIYLGIEV